MEHIPLCFLPNEKKRLQMRQQRSEVRLGRKETLGVLQEPVTLDKARAHGTNRLRENLPKAR